MKLVQRKLLKVASAFIGVIVASAFGQFCPRTRYRVMNKRNRDIAKFVAILPNIATNVIFHPFVAILGSIATNLVTIMRVMTTRKNRSFHR